MLMLALAQGASAAEPGYGPVKRLFKSLEVFARKERLTWSQLQDLLFNAIVESPCLEKSGLNLIGENIYVNVNDDVNSLLLNQTSWKGKTRASSEVVLISNYQVIKDGDSLSENDPLVVIFSPKQIRFIDYKNKRAGTYKRVMK